MPRPDLLALTADDLAALANRGLVKRAQKELESGEISVTWTEEADGTINAVWSDEIHCHLPGAKTLKDGHCNCGALELCRHLLRTVLAWQTRAAAVAPGDQVDEDASWDPGRIGSETLATQVSVAVRERADKLWRDGVLAELLRGRKPLARFYFPGHTVRFLVPDDVRYSQCSCADPAPCVHAVLAVYAFRELAAQDDSGLVCRGQLELKVPAAPLDAGRAVIAELLEHGLATLPAPWRDRTLRAAAACSAASLFWPAQILQELAEDFERYHQGDAAFTPTQFLLRAGEFLLRADALQADELPVPQAFVCGLKSDRDAELGTARFIGLGARVEENRGRPGTKQVATTAFTIFLQDCFTGHGVTVTREFKNQEGEARPYHQLARGVAVREASIAALASGQLLCQGGKRSASGRLTIGRARAAVNPQDFSWQQLKAPILVEDFAEIAGRLELLPPAPFRPRRVDADFHVCPLARVLDAAFNARRNAVVARLIDATGAEARLEHPFRSRGRAGAEALLAALKNAQPLFVAGKVNAEGRGLCFHPTALVVADAQGQRRVILPWLDLEPPTPAITNQGQPSFASTARYAAAAELAEDLLLVGLERTAERSWPGWQRTMGEFEESGCHRIAAILRAVREPDRRWSAANVLLKILVLEHSLCA